MANGFTLNNLLGVASSASNLGQTILGSRMQQQGSEMQAAGFRQAANSSLAAAEYNNRILELNTQRRLEALGRQIRTISAEQRVAAVSSGFASSSRSKLAVMDATLDQYSRQISNEAVSLGHQQQANLFEAQTAATALETRARTAEFQAAQARSRQTPSILASIGNLASTIGGLF